MTVKVKPEVREKLIWIADLVLALFVVIYTVLRRRKRYLVYTIVAIIIIALALLTLLGVVRWDDIAYEICRHVWCGW